jgi:leucyl aminopeptidase
MDTYFTSSQENSIPIRWIKADSFHPWLSEQDSVSQKWIKHHDFLGKSGQLLSLPKADGSISEILWGMDPQGDFWQCAALAQKLPPGNYHFTNFPESIDPNFACLAWGLAFYQFGCYKTNTPPTSTRLCWPSQVLQEQMVAMLESIQLIRDLINTPACDCLPQDLSLIARRLADQYGATVKVIQDEELQQQYPCIYTVGKAAQAAPCLIDLTWQHPQPLKKITLVGKGVCFDSGGLDIKPSSNMVLMKKDMAGAAHVLGLARLIMTLKLPIQLRVLIPAVENAIGGNAMRPLDIIRTKKGLTVEIGNTDAEGRLILADALYEACLEEPDMIIDFATLTGAARMAMGTEVPAFFCNQDNLAHAVIQAAQETQDPLWQLPLYQPYKKQLKSTIADLSSTGKSSYGGAITAALFLEHFVKSTVPWVHLDLMAWNLSSTPGRPEGGEAMGIRAIYHLIKKIL